MLRAFGALPTGARAQKKKARDFLWCAVNLVLDREEELNRLCPSCRAQAEEARCLCCGAPLDGVSVGQNASFDEERFERLKRGETG